MEPSAELNRLVLSLLQELKIYKAKCLSQNTGIAMILKMTPEQRSSLTRDAVRAATDEAHVEALKEVNEAEQFVREHHEMK